MNNVDIARISVPVGKSTRISVPSSTFAVDSAWSLCDVCSGLDVFLGLRRLSKNKPLLQSLKTPFAAHRSRVHSKHPLEPICLDLQHIGFQRTPRDPATAAAVSKFVLTANRSALRTLDTDSPLTQEARGVVPDLLSLRGRLVFIEKDTRPPSLLLPSLTPL